MTTTGWRLAFQFGPFLGLGLLFLPTLAGCGASTAAGDGKTQPRIVDARPDSGGRPVVASAANTVAVAYAGPSPAYDLYLARSTDGGATFGPTGGTFVDAGGLSPKSLIIVGDAIYVAYHVPIMRGGEGGAADVLTYEVRLARSDDGGRSFAIQTVANGVGPALLGDGKRIYLVYDPYGEPGGAPYFRRSDDGGATWSAPVCVSPKSDPGPISVSGLLGSTLSLALSAGELCLSFYDRGSNAQRAAHSGDGGDTWVVEAGQGLLAVGSMVTVGDELLLPLVDKAAHALIGASRDAGETWTRRAFDVGGADFSDNPVADANDSHLAGPHLASAGDALYTVFNQGTIGEASIGFARSNDHGATWPAANVMTAIAGGVGFELFPAEHAQIVVSTAPVPALLIAVFDGIHLRVARSTDDGASWQ